MQRTSAAVSCTTTDVTPSRCAGSCSACPEALPPAAGASMRTAAPPSGPAAGLEANVLPFSGALAKFPMSTFCGQAAARL